jgi:hypothetical protein
MFLNPVMLAGVGGAAVPLALHFLSRSRFRTVDWGGMMFLADVPGRRASGASVRQWTLLALRMAIVGLLSVALARPVVAGLWGDDAPGHRLVVLVLDCSASMAADEPAGRTRMDLAKDAALRILTRRAHVGDLVGLILTGRDGTTTAADATPDVQSVAARLASLSPGAGAADDAGALVAALDLCDRADRGGQGLSREIYIVGDRQARSWDGAGDAFAAAWQARWATARRTTRLYAVPVGGDSAENVGVESVDLTDDPVVRGQPTGVEVRVRNYGSQPRTGVPVTLSVAGHATFSTAVNIEPGAAETLRTTVKFPDAGPGLLTASVASPDLAADNRMDLAMDVAGPLKVLVLSGDEPAAAAAAAGAAPRGESAFLKLALAPFPGEPATAPAAPANLADVTVARPDDPNPPLAAANVVILANVPKLPDPTVAKLEQFVYAGGGLVIAPGSLTQVDEYRRTLYRNGAGVMPAALRPPGSDGAGPTSLLGLTLDHPVFRFLRGAGASPIPPVSITRYFPADVREGDARVLASYQTGAPFLIEGTFGRGRILLLTTPLDADWSDLPLTNFYLPFVQSCVRYASGASRETRNLRTGDPLVARLDPKVADSSVRVRRPGGAVTAAGIELARDPAGVTARYPATRAPGHYTLSYDAAGARHDTLFVVRPPASESDLTPLGEESWDRLRHSLGLAELPAADDPTEAGFLAALGGRFRNELWLPLIAAVVALLLAEGLLSRSWSAAGEAP